MNRNHLPYGTSVRGAAGAACAVAAALVLAGPCEVAAQIPSTAAHRSFSLGGALGQSGESYDDFHFSIDRTAVLFARADSAIYQSAGRQGEDDCGGGENSAAADTALPAACEDEGGHAERTTLCLQALDPSGQVLCWAERAAQPGWQRDPRLGCVLTPEPGVEPDRPHFTPVVDAKNNLTYVDVYVTEQGGSSSGSEAIRRRGKGRVPGGR